MGTMISTFKKRFGNLIFILLLLPVTSLLITHLITGKPTIFGVRPMFVASESMEPTLPVGTILIGYPVAVEDVRVGDIVGYWAGEKYIGINPVIVHRVIEINSEGFILKGDNNQDPDRVVKAEQIMYIIKNR